MSNHEAVWNATAQLLKAQVSEGVWYSTFNDVVALTSDDESLRLQVPNAHVRDRIVTRYRPLVIDALDEIGESDRELIIEISDIQPTLDGEVAVTETADVATIPVKANGGKGLAVGLNPRYTFDNFVEGDCNKLARNAGLAIAQKPGGTAFNPLMVFGGCGLGKTHLTHAIGNLIKQTHQQKVVVFVSAEKFINQFIDSAKQGNNNQFINFYQYLDVLIVDDVQFFAKKERTQEIFFQIFNHLHQNGKQIILACDRAPKDLKNMDERLLSRFKWGLSADLNTPDFDTRVSILENKMYQDGITLNRDVVEYLAHNIDTNVRELEGALISLLAQASLTRKQLDLNLAKQIVKNFVKNSTREISIDYIQKLVCDFYNIPVEAVKSKTRKREIVQARQIAMYFTKDLTKASLKNIGIFFGGRDHSTVIHACQTVNDLIETDKKFRHDVEEIEKRIKINTF